MYANPNSPPEVSAEAIKVLARPRPSQEVLAKGVGQVSCRTANTTRRGEISYVGMFQITRRSSPLDAAAARLDYIQLVSAKALIR